MTKESDLVYRIPAKSNPQYMDRIMESVGHKDMLEMIFQHQQLLANVIIEKAGKRFPYDKVNQVDVLCDATLQEILELKNLTDWKYWKKFDFFDIDAAREELIDALHFLIHLAIVMDMSPESFFKEYMRKWQINMKRQENEY